MRSLASEFVIGRRDAFGGRDIRYKGRAFRERKTGRKYVLYDPERLFDRDEPIAVFDHQLEVLHWIRDMVERDASR